jgi:hypothetical protein
MLSQIVAKKNKRAFIISAFVSVITIGYIWINFVKHQRPKEVDMILLGTILPILYGLVGIMNYRVPAKYSFLVGAAFGLFLSIIGRFALNLPTLIFGFTQQTEYKVHLHAAILYAAIFQFIVTPLQHINF